MVSSRKAVTDDHVCVAVHPCKVNKHYSNSRVRGYGLLGKLSLIIRQLEPDTSKIHQDKCECYGVLSRGGVEEGTIVVYWLEKVVDSCTLLTSKSGIRSSELAKSKLALLQMNPTSLYLDTYA